MPKQKKPLNTFVKYSSVAFQMAATIILCLFLGKFLDRYFSNSKPILTAVLSTFGVVIAIINLIRSVIKNE